MRYALLMLLASCAGQMPSRQTYSVQFLEGTPPVATGQVCIVQPANGLECMTLRSFMALARKKQQEEAAVEPTSDL